MKALSLSLLAAIGIFSTGVAQADQALAQAKGCLACHSVDKKIVGPAYKDVAKKYTAKDEAKLVDKVMKGGGGVWGPVPMPPNNVTKEEATKLVKWVLSQK